MTVLPCAERILLKVREATRPRHRLVMIQHLLPDTAEFVNLISETYDLVSVIGIPYSTKEEVVQELQKECRVVASPTIAGMLG